ncbi:MAG: ATP-binding protein [Chloroflexota bacterium]|nr:ATP-binding protein [Chloroflexota bacterium]
MTDNVITPLGYDEGSIRVLEGIDHIRLRPGMYVGGTDIGALHHLVYEIVDNAVDEALAGRCDRIDITLQDDNIVTVADNGVGIPVGINRETGLSTLEVVFTKTGAGGKFDNSAYKVSGGLHGVGAAAVNALSENLRAHVYRDNKLWEQQFSRGRPLGGVVPIRDLAPGEPTGTVVTFQPDFTIMQPNDYKYETLLQRFREIAFVNRGLTIRLRDERIKPFPDEMTFYFDGGLGSYVRYLNRNRVVLHPVIHMQRAIDVAPEGAPAETVDVEVAFQYTDAGSVTEIAFANTIVTPDGGTHLTGLRSAITGAINRYARKAGLLKEKEQNFSGRDTLEGITAVISVKLSKPSFGGQTKEKLINPEVQGAVSSVVTEAFNEFMDVNAREAKRIVEKCMLSMRAYEAARKARDLVRSGPSLLESSSLPGKLADCSQHGAGAEIFLVEGDSAGGCFSGDTRIALADGRALSFVEIMAEQADGKEHFCYTIRHDGTIGLERVLYPRVTKYAAEVIRITLDNGEVITCTPEHRFMLRDGSYRAAEMLTPDASLMPLQPSSSERRGMEFGADAVEQFNHRVVQIDRVAEPIDVYDIEVPGTHNFALASGVFVHNSAKQARDRHFQAILPLRGKILNTERSRLDKMLDNNEIKALVSALGTGISDDMDVSKLRYHRVVLMTDADVDGAHIRTLLLTFFFRHMQSIISGGHLYIAQPPLFRLQQGKDAQYFYPQAGKGEQEILQQALTNFKDPDKVKVSRYKGLGEMNPDQLWETTMDPNRRAMLQVTIDNAADADHVFDMLMGSEVPPRRRFIQTHAKNVRNLDV